MDYGLTENEITILTDLLKKYSEIDTAIIFGSRALRTYTKGSDVDIALKGNISSSTISSLRSDIDDTTLPYFFDILDYASIKEPKLKEHIDKYGKIFYLKGWKKTTLGEVAEINPTESIRKGKKAKYIGMDHITPFSRKIVQSDIKEFKGGMKFRNGDTLLARITPCLENGKTSYVDILDDGEVGFGSTEYIVIRERENLSDKKFLYYFAISPHFRAIAIKAMSGTSGRQRVQTNVLINKLFAFPPFPEQRAIAAVLSSLDDKIELLREQNKTLEATAQAIYKEWFVRFNFPDKDGKPYRDNGGKMKDSELGEIPEGWRVKKLGDLVDLTIGRTPPRKEPEWFSLNPSDIKWLSIKDLGESEIYAVKTSEFLTQEAIEKHRMNIVPKDTVVISFKLTVGRVAITLEEMTTNEAIAHLRLYRDPEVTAEFLYLFFRAFDFNSIGSTSSIATAFNSKSLRILDILVPIGNVVQKFDQVIKPLFKKIANNIYQIQTLSSLRDVLLPKLMRGEIRVKKEIYNG